MTLEIVKVKPKRLLDRVHVKSKKIEASWMTSRNFCPEQGWGGYAMGGKQMLGECVEEP